MKPFDDRFADRVREVFDAYSEPVDPAALAALRRRMQKGMSMIPVSAVTLRIAAAATVLLVAGAALWVLRPWEPSAPAEVVSADTIPGAGPRSDDLPATIGILTDDEADELTAVPDTDPDPDPYVSSPLTAIQPRTVDQVRVPEPRAQGSDLPENRTADPAIPAIVQQELADLTESAEEQGIPQLTEMLDIPEVYKTPVLQTVPELPATRLDTMITVRETGGIELPGLIDRPVRPMPALSLPGLATAGETTSTSIAETGVATRAANGVEEGPLPAIPAHQRRYSGSGPGIAAGSMLTYAGNQLAGGVGFFAGGLFDWSISETVSLSSGGLLAWNRFDYEPTGTAVGEQAVIAELFSNNRAGSEMDVDLSYNMRREYSWVAVDIPVNLRWDVGGNSHGRYNLTFGLSSLVYLSQSYTGEGLNYSGRVVRNDASNSFDVQLESSRFSEKSDEPAFSRFDFARLMNVGLGYTIRNRGNPLSFELYMKYPLGNLTSREISFGMGGISMRYSIGK